MRKLYCLIGLGLLLAGALRAEPALPISHVVLHKNGMAYIVRSGELSGNASFAFSNQDMNDILKSFTAWNPVSGALFPVGYSAAIPLEHFLQRFPYDLGARPGLAAFLRQVQGVELRIGSGSLAVSGRLMSIEAENRAVSPQTVIQDHRLTLLEPDGRLRQYWLADAEAVSLTDPREASRLREYLEIVAEGTQETTAQLTVQAEGAPGPARVSYIQQFPVWKTTYRLDLGDSSRLQAWAQIDNPTGEAWNDVDLTLVSGMPATFEMDLYPPLYASRTRLAIPGSEAVAPRFFEEAVVTGRAPREPNTLYGTVFDEVGAIIPGAEVAVRHSETGTEARTVTGDGGDFQLSGLQPGPLDVTISLHGFRTYRTRVQLPSGGRLRLTPTLVVGEVTEAVTVEGPAAAVQRFMRPEGAPPAAPADGAAPSIPEAEARSMADYFEYRFPFSVRLAPRQSALLPFLNRVVEAARITIVNPKTAPGSARIGVNLRNDAGVPLDAGPLVILQDGRYVGESVMHSLSQGESRLIGYGVDPDVAVSHQGRSDPERTVRVRIGSGVAYFYQETVQRTEYELRNKGPQEKQILIEHPRDARRELRGIEPNETTAGYFRFRMSLGPGEEAAFPVQEVLSRQTTVALNQLNERHLQLYFSGPSIPRQIRERLQEILSVQRRVFDLRGSSQELDRRIQSLFSDQERLRENLKALGTGGEDQTLRRRYLSELNQQEDQLKELRDRFQAIQEEVRSEQTRLEQMIASLEWESDPD